MKSLTIALWMTLLTTIGFGSFKVVWTATAAQLDDVTECSTNNGQTQP
ncbi:MAG: hypothetical protein H6693_06755 [Candidatus Latescibacteria bacterium]|nr:hypothetical protein [Candidatus Latescibacterota bacterium]